MYSVILLLASVTLTVSSLLNLSIPKRPEAASRATASGSSTHGGVPGNEGVSLSLSVCHASGPVCPPELLEVGPQAGILSTSTLRRLPPLLHWL